MTRPVLVSLALDHEAPDAVRTAAVLAAKLDVPLASVHALPSRPLETDAHLEARMAEAKEQLDALLTIAHDEGCEVLEPIVVRERVVELVLRTAVGLEAQMIVTGGGSAPTVSRWMLGSTAEQLVRVSPVPVLVARGTRHEQGTPIVCPVDLSPQSRVGFQAALRMARLFESPLVALHVIPSAEHGRLSAERIEAEVARGETVQHELLERFLAGSDTTGVKVEPKVLIGDPAELIVEEAERGWLLVIGSRGFNDLVPGAVGRVTERALRFSRVSALAVRDSDPGRDEREGRLRELGGYKQLAEKRIADGEHARALPLLQVLATYAPADASIQERIADVMEALGRADDAERHRGLARLIRESFA
jgi:nucleotide-binding universal stress UspA family protein